MRVKPIITTVFGIAIAAGSVFFIKEYLLDAPNSAAQGAKTDLVDIYLAHTEIAFGQIIEPHHVTKHAWPRDALPPGAFTTIAQLVPAQEVDRRRAKGRFFPGEVMIASKVSQFGEKVTLVQRLGENTRAMSIKVDAVTAVGGFVTPGDYVDIVLTQGASLDLRAVTILQNIRVIGVDQQSEELTDEPEVARTITVEISADQGQRLALAQRAGILSLTLRTLEGVEDKPMEMVRLRDLLQEEGPVEKVSVQPTITVRRGTASEVVSIRRTVPDIDPVLLPETLADDQPLANPDRSAWPALTEQIKPAAEEITRQVEINLKPLARPRPVPSIRPITVTQTIEQ